MSKDINKDECKDLEKQEMGLECRIKNLENEVGKLGDEMQKLNATQEKMLEVIILSTASTLGDKEAARDLKELLKKQKSERND